MSKPKKTEKPATPAPVPTQDDLLYVSDVVWKAIQRAVDVAM